MAPKKGSKRVVKEHAPLDLSAVQAKRVEPGPDMRMSRATRGERDQEQRAVDDLVNQAWKAWQDAERPEAWEDTPGTEVTVPSAQMETLQWRIRRAQAHYGIRVKFGDISSADGYSTVVFIATDKPEKTPDGDESGGSESGDESDGAGVADVASEELERIAQNTFGRPFSELSDAEADSVFAARESELQNA